MAGTYKSQAEKGTVGSFVSAAFDEVESLAEECRSAYDNMTGSGMSDENPAVQRWGEVADLLEGVERCDDEAPDGADELAAVTSILVPTRKKYNPSRATRCTNAQSMLEAAASACREEAERIRSEAEDNDHEPEEGEDEASDPALEAENGETDADELAQSLEEYADKLDEAANELSGAEFPGMRG